MTYTQQIQSLSFDELQNLFEQYSEMESKSVNDDIRLELIAQELDNREEI